MTRFPNPFDDTQPTDMNPYRAPQSSLLGINRDAANMLKHRNFRLTADNFADNRHFVIGNLRRAIIFAALQQSVWIAITACIPNAGNLVNMAVCSAAIFWVLFAAIACLQRGQIGPQQKLAIKWGYLPVFLIIANIQHLLLIILLRS